MKEKPIYQKKTCLKCKKQYKPFSGNQLYCGSRKYKIGCVLENRKEEKRLYNKKRRKEIVLLRKVCVFCGKNFNTFRKTKIYCSRICRKKANDGYGNLNLRFQIFLRDNFTCQYCGRKTPEVILEIDHKYPRSKGGKHSMQNKITACRECNRGKRDILLE